MKSRSARERGASFDIVRRAMGAKLLRGVEALFLGGSDHFATTGRIADEDGPMKVEVGKAVTRQDRATSLCSPLHIQSSSLPQ